MKNYIALVLVFATLASCKTAAVVAEGKATTDMAAASIIKGHYANSKDFKTVYIKSSAQYEDDKQSQRVTAEIRIKKDEQILVSVRFLGITMAKALITPKSVKYYEKINSSYFEGDYAMLSRWLGTDLDFEKVQNMLIGQAMDDLHKASYTATVDKKYYKLERSDPGNTQKFFYFEGENYLIKKQEISQPSQQRDLTVSYPGYAQYSGTLFPVGLLIEASQAKGKTMINVDYDTVSFDEEMSFPYSVPSGYERIYIK